MDKPVERQSQFPGIDLIRCFPNKPSNLQSVRVQFAMAMISKHGDTANCIKTGVAHVEEETPMPLMSGSEVQNAASMSRYYKAVERRDVEIEHQRKQSPKLYADMILQLSRESEAKLRDHGDFNATDIAMDPVRLWNLIVLVLTGGDRLDEIEALTVPLDRYYSLQMEPKEPLPHFKDRFDDAVGAIIMSGQHPPPAAHQAQNFIDRLNASYNSMNLEYKNKLKLKPRTLAEAYQAASERRMLSSQGLAVPVTDATVFVTMKGHKEESSDDSDDTDGKAGDHEKKKKNRRRTKNKNKTANETPAAPSDLPEPNKSDPPKLPTRDCVLCSDRKKAEDRRHWTSDCPRLPQLKDLIRDGTIAAAFGHQYEPFGDEDVIL